MEEKDEVAVIQNADSLYRADVKWIDPITPVEPSEYEKEMLKNTKKPEEILEEEKYYKPVELTDEQIKEKEKRDIITMVKVVALDIMGKNPLSNPSYFTQKEKQQLIKIMETVLEKEVTQIRGLFNDVCTDKLFHPTAEYSSYPVYRDFL